MKPPNEFTELGDRVEQALTSIGITSDRVSQWMGRPCNCEDRKEKLNQISSWARRVTSGKTKKAKEYLEKILND